MSETHRPPHARTLGHLAVVGAALGVLAGCVAPRLVNERCQPPYADLIARYEARAPRQERVAVAPRAGARVDVALDVLTSPAGAAGPVLVLQPGILADATTWRFLMGALGGEHDLIAVSPPGTGASDAPEPGPLGSATYSPTWLADVTLGALEAWEARGAPAREYVLVGHSLGAAVVLRALADPGLAARHGALLGRVRGAVLIAPADIALERRDPKLVTIATLSDLKAGVAERLGLLQQGVREGVRDNAIHPERDALRSEALRIEALMGRPATRHAAQAMLQRFQPSQDGVHADLVAARRMAADERRITQPILLLWGAADRTLPVTGAEVFRERLAHEELQVLSDVGHSAHQEGVLHVAGHMRAFLAGLARGSATAR